MKCHCETRFDLLSLAEAASLIFSMDTTSRRHAATLIQPRDIHIGRRKQKSSMNPGMLSLPLRAETLTLSLFFSALATGQSTATARAPQQKPAPQFAARQQAPGSQPEPPSAPTPASSSSQEPSLSDLSFTTRQTQGSPELQAELNKRTEMLKVHQRLGLVTCQMCGTVAQV